MKRKFVDHAEGQKVHPQIQEEIGAFEGNVFRVLCDYNFCTAKRQNEFLFKKCFTLQNNSPDIASEAMQSLDLRYNKGLWGVLTLCFKN